MADGTEDRFSHLDESGAARMVDVSAKAPTSRTAKARCRVLLSDKTMQLLVDQALPKGEALNTARIAGIQAAKRTAEFIPLCHPLALSFVDVRFEVHVEINEIEVECEARLTGQTGVEMEALVGCQIAAATIYDMVKAVQKDVVVTDLRLIHKSGGKSGTFNAE